MGHFDNTLKAVLFTNDKMKKELIHPNLNDDSNLSLIKACPKVTFPFIPSDIVLRKHPAVENLKKAPTPWSTSNILY